MLKIWGRPDSTPTQRVMWICRELGVAYEMSLVGGPHGGLDTPEYLEKNPNRQVPAVEVDGTVLWESNTIVRYIAARYGGQRLWISDPLARANAEKWMDWGLSVAVPAMVPSYMAIIRGGDRSMIASSVKKSAAAWRVAESGLSDGRAYLAGDTFSVADISLGPLVYRYLKLDIERPSLPRVEAWYERLTERPLYRELVIIPLT